MLQVTTISQSDISKAIGSILRRGKNLDRDIWQTAVNAVAHAQQHGDCSLLGRLYQAMPKGSRRQTLAAWVSAATNIEINNQGKARLNKDDDRFPSPEDWNMEYLLSVAWYDHKTEQKETEFGLDDLRKYLTRLESAKNTNRKKYSAEVKEMAKLLGMAMDRVSTAAETRVPEKRRLKSVA